MNCEYCRKILKRKQRFCCDSCRYLWWKEHPAQRKLYSLTCAGCGIIFKAIRKTRKYHSIDCRNKANSRRYTENIENEKKHITWACGGGIDSTAIAVLIIQGIIPRPDFAYMTDCGFEPTYVMDYVQEIIREKLKKINLELTIINSRRYVAVNIVNKHGVTIPAYTCNSKGKIIKLHTRCSSTWKVRPAIRWLKEQGVKRMLNMVGIAVNERNRMKESPVKWIENGYPLVSLNISRRDCKKIIKEAGWPMPQRSSCVMCPQQTDNEWLDIRESYPEDWNRAVAIERDMRMQKPFVFLHRSCVPLDQVKFIGGGGINSLGVSGL